MARNLTSKLCSAIEIGLLLAGLAGCGSGWETATELPKAPRRPDGVAVEPPPAMPSTADHAEAHGVVALREPLADKDVEDVVRAYIRGFEREEPETLVQLLAQEAAPIGRAGATRQQLIESWRTRIKSYEYQRLAGAEVARYSEIERLTYEAVGAHPTYVRPNDMRPGDLYVRVPILTPRLNGEQLFGDVVVLMLRREDGRLKIAGQADENGN
ncbi:MAG: hypothetical protein U0270_10445 [Labilithrix sp.]